MNKRPIHANQHVTVMCFLKYSNQTSTKPSNWEWSMKVKFLGIVSQNKSTAQELCSTSSAPYLIWTLERPPPSGCVRHMRQFCVSSCHRSSALVAGPLWALEISHADCWPTFRTSAGEEGKQEVVEKTEERERERETREVGKYSRGKQNHSFFYFVSPFYAMAPSYQDLK